MSTGQTRVIKCPGCDATYRIPASGGGRLRCKGCGATFSAAAGGKRPPRGRAKDSDQKMVVKLMFLGGGLLLVTAIVVMSLGKNTSDAPLKPGPRKTSVKRTAYIKREAAPPGYVKPDHPKTLTVQFLKALSEGNEEGIRKTFSMDLYWKWAAHKYSYDDASEMRYDLVGPERKKELEELALDGILSDPQLNEYVKRLLIPDLESDTAQPVSWDHGINYGRWEYLVKDSNGDPLFNIAISTKLKEGLDPYTDGLVLKNWAVSRMERKYHKSGFRAGKPDRSAVDTIIGVKKKREKEERKKLRRALASGPLEADPTEQAPLEGTGGTQVEHIRRSVRVLQSSASSGPEMHRARSTLEDVGKPAIPFLLNSFLGKDHKEDEDAIMNAMPIIEVLRQLTGESFGYGPPTAAGMMGGMGLAGATPDQRVRAIRRWFGWWSQNAKTWAGRKPASDEEEDG